MSWMDQLKGDSLAWLLEDDQPGVRYLAMRDLLDLPADDTGLQQARSEAHRSGPIAEVLANMQPEGWWVEPGPGYNPKYRSTVWAMILLAQMGGSVKEDMRIQKACNYVLDHAVMPGGQISYSTAPSGTFDCLQGNIVWSLLSLGCTDPRLDKAIDWMTRSVTGDGIAPMEDRHAPVRYYASKCGPLFACGATDKKPCAWGGVKVMMAFSKVSAPQRTPMVERAIKMGIDFFLSIDPTTAAWSTASDAKPNGSWWKFGFPVFYITDLLQVAEALTALGCGRDPRMQGLLELILAKQDGNGRWPLEYNYSGKTWLEFGEKKQPNKWVTLRALRVLKHSYS